MGEAAPLRGDGTIRGEEGGECRPEPVTKHTGIGRFLLAVLTALALGVILTACADKKIEGILQNISDDRHSIANPSKRYASATGIGCGKIRKEALTTARQVAQYNLRSLTGPARYRIRYDIVREFSESNNICFEVSAQASP